MVRISQHGRSNDQGVVGRDVSEPAVVQFPTQGAGRLGADPQPPVLGAAQVVRRSQHRAVTAVLDSGDELTDGERSSRTGEVGRVCGALTAQNRSLTPLRVKPPTVDRSTMPGSSTAPAAQ